MLVHVLYSLMQYMVFICIRTSSFNIIYSEPLLHLPYTNEYFYMPKMHDGGVIFFSDCFQYICLTVSITAITIP